jgi:hypothetical protein
MILKKKYAWIILFSFSLIVCVLFYLKYDCEGYEYGLGYNFCNKKMPYNLKPHNGTQFSFTLKDEDDYELVGIGFSYRKSSIKIKDFLAFGYNDTSVVIKCTDSLNTIKYLISYETGYKNKNDNPEISFKDLRNIDYEKVKDKYKWHEVSKEKYYTLDRNKFLLTLGTLLSLFFIIRQLFKLM